MKLDKIFRKPVGRPIEGVIKADDSDHLHDEVDEYVLTNEIEKKLEDFLDAYNNYAGANGAWISGFFGSGKSHLLKMISLLLANDSVDGQPVVESFVAKCHDNKLLQAALRKSGTIPAKSILFNIDQKADVISKSEVDALLAVFVKVFDESCGYYGKQGYIAEFERVLDEDQLLENFKTEFSKLEEKGWEWARMRVNRFAAQIDKAYATVTGQKVVGIIDRYKADYKVSIEDFADQVNDYVRRHDNKDFRLNFFVDEVGQYISEHTKLMTNLQTIAESLATKCKGRAWIIVTAQEDMNTVVGEMGKQQGNDFSKIQARFANRLSLTSKDVAEVIQKRLLAKTEDGAKELGALYDEQVNNFKTIFDFSDGSVQYRNYQGKEHFKDCYPFVPYQFDLFQSSIRNLSDRNAFTGKHSSVGERSMLGVFQDVAKGIANHEVREIATFDMMFEGLRAALKSQIQSAILNAERNLTNPLAIRLLKALFLVKYVREFKPTLRNLCVLMLNHFDADLGDLQKKVEEALNLLENQVYIQRNGELYEYLTDEEKDVEQEIKNTEIDTTDIADELSKIIFDQVIKAKKLRYDDTKQDYGFTRKLDDRVFGRAHELSRLRSNEPNRVCFAALLRLVPDSKKLWIPFRDDVVGESENLMHRLQLVTGKRIVIPTVLDPNARTVDLHDDEAHKILSELVIVEPKGGNQDGYRKLMSETVDWILEAWPQAVHQILNEPVCELRLFYARDFASPTNTRFSPFELYAAADEKRLFGSNAQLCDKLQSCVVDQSILYIDSPSACFTSALGSDLPPCTPKHCITLLGRRPKLVATIEQRVELLEQLKSVGPDADWGSIRYLLHGRTEPPADKLSLITIDQSPWGSLATQLLQASSQSWRAFDEALLDNFNPAEKRSLGIEACVPVNVAHMVSEIDTVSLDLSSLGKNRSACYEIIRGWPLGQEMSLRRIPIFIQGDGILTAITDHTFINTGNVSPPSDIFPDLQLIEDPNGVVASRKLAPTLNSQDILKKLLETSDCHKHWRYIMDQLDTASDPVLKTLLVEAQWLATKSGAAVSPKHVICDDSLASHIAMLKEAGVRLFHQSDLLPDLRTHAQWKRVAVELCPSKSALLRIIGECVRTLPSYRVGASTWQNGRLETLLEVFAGAEDNLPAIGLLATLRNLPGIGIQQLEQS